MALVAYDNSDSSEFEDDDHESTSPTVLPNSQQAVTEISTLTPIANGLQSHDENPRLFNLLPQPSNKKLEVVEEDDEFLHKTETPLNIVKPKAKITIPSLSDFKDVGSLPVNKPRTASVKKSGLLSMLPQPKNAVTTTKTLKSLIPNVLTKKPAAPTAKKKVPLPSSVTQSKAKPLSLDYSDDSDNDDEVQNDFFSINKAVELPVIDVPLDVDANVNKVVEKPNNQSTSNIQSYFKQNEVYESGDKHTQFDYLGSQEPSSFNHNTPASSGNEVLLDEEAIRQLCGTRGKRKREEIQIVDVHQQEVLDEARSLLMKGLHDDTATRVSASKKKGNEPTSQQRRKHQITYLAHQAKANEAELQNQWANNRMSKRQTQSKYGF